MPTRSGRNFSAPPLVGAPLLAPGAAAAALGQGRGSQRDMDQDQRAGIQLADLDAAHDAPVQAGRNVARRVVLATYNCQGLRDGAIAEIIDFCAEKSAVILALQDIGGNRQEPAAARLLAHADTLQAAGLSVWTGGLADSNVALVHSASLTQAITYHTSTHTHLVSMQVGAQHRVCSAYWRPATSSAGASSQLAICDLDAACTDNTILLGDLNAEVITVDGKTTANRNDSRSRVVARWLRTRSLTSTATPPTWRRDTLHTTIDHIICAEENKMENVACRWSQYSDHAILHADTENIPVAAAQLQPARSLQTFQLPAYGHAKWHVYGHTLKQSLRTLADSLPANDAGEAQLQAVADNLHNAITSAAKACFVRRKQRPNKRRLLPKNIREAKRALRRHQRGKQHLHRNNVAAFEQRTRQLKAKLAEAITTRRKQNSLSFAQRNSKMLQKLASRQAWAQVKRTMAKGQRKHSALQQYEFLSSDGSASTENKAVIHSHLSQILECPSLPQASPEALQRLEEVCAPPTVEPSFGEGAPSDKGKPAAEGEYPRTPWQQHTWGNEAASEVGQNRFSAKFIKDAVQQLATQSGGGEDGITAELLRWVDSHHVATIRKQVPEGSPQYEFVGEGNSWHWPVIMDAVARCFNLFAKNSFIPSQWKRSKTLLVHKKGPTNEVRNYRPIAAGNTLGKLFAHCVLHGLEGWATTNGVLSTLQRGFRSHRGCEDCILALLSILRSHGSVGDHSDQLSTTHLCFVDFAGAYDSVDHARLLLKLERIGVRGPVLSIIAEMLNGRTTVGRTVEGDTSEVRVTRGLPQGHVLSPMLFSLFVNDLLLRLQKAGEGVRGGSKLANTPALAYADDIVLIDRKMAGLQSKLDIVRMWSEDWGMTVNLKKGKTEHMVFGGERKRNFTLRFGAEVVRRTKSYKYLGVMLDSEDTKLSMLAQRQKTLRSAFGAHNAVAQLQVASPDMPLGTIGSIWQTWVLPQLCYGIGAWGRSDATEVLESFAYRCGKVLLGATHKVPRAIVQAEMGWRSVRFWVRYHQCRTLSRLLRAPEGDLMRAVLLDQLAMLHSRPQQSWLQPVLQELSQSSFRQAAALRRWLENVLPVLNPGRMETARQELSAMHFEEAWAGSVLHDEFMEWQQEVYRGPTRAHFAAHVSERRDRGPGMDVKPRWATIMRPSRSLRHLVGRADSKLLSETRMGSVRSLSYRANPHRAVLGHACPCCGGAEDTASHMLQCGVIMGDIRVEEAFDHFHDAMEGRVMEGNAEDDDILNLGELVRWMQSFPAGGGAHKVLLGNGDLRQVPQRMRRAYMQMQMDAGLHNLWLQCCVSVIRAAWATHDAAVEDKLAAGDHALPAVVPDGAEVPAVARPAVGLRQPQSDVRNMVSQFCAIGPNRSHQGVECPGGRVRQAHAAQHGDIADGGEFSEEPPALSDLGGPAEACTGAQYSRGAASSGSGSGGAPSAACRTSSMLPAVNGLGQLAAWGSRAGREEAHSSAARCAWAEGADGSGQAAYNAQRLQRECEILVEVGLVVRCDQCTNSGVLVFNELCESCRVEVEGQARACINGALS